VLRTAIDAQLLSARISTGRGRLDSAALGLMFE